MTTIEEEINGPEPISIDNVTVGSEIRVFGRIRSNESWVIHREENENGIKEWVKRNFSLVQDDVEIMIIVTNDTDAYQFHEPDDEVSGYGNGDLVYVIGKSELHQGEVAIRAEKIMDKEFEYGEARSWLKVIKIMISFMGGLIFITTANNVLSPGIIPRYFPRGINGKYLIKDHHPIEESGQSVEEMAIIEHLRESGTKKVFQRRKVFIIIGILCLSILGIMKFGYYWLVTTWPRTETNLAILLFLFFSLFIPTIIFMYSSDKTWKSLKWTIVGEEGILLSMDTVEPYFISWDEMDNVISLGNNLTIITEPEVEWRIKTSRSINDVIHQHWKMIEMRRIVDGSKGYSMNGMKCEA